MRDGEIFGNVFIGLRFGGVLQGHEHRFAIFARGYFVGQGGDGDFRIELGKALRGGFFRVVLLIDIEKQLRVLILDF